MSNHKFKTMDRLKWWRIRQRIARFGWKSFIILAFISGIAWLTDSIQIALFMLYASYGSIGVTIVIILSQSFDLNEEISEDE